MLRLAILVWLITTAVCFQAQTTSQPAPTSDPQAISLAQESLAALTGGASISDVTIKANVISLLGASSQSGTGIFQAKGWQESIASLSLNGGTQAEARTVTNGLPAGSWSQNGSPSTAMSQQNTWIDASWFFPPLSSLSKVSNPQFVFNYVGEEQRNGAMVQHIRTFQLPSANSGNSAVSTLSVMDFYLDPNSFLPLAIDFTLHADTNTGINVPIEIRFANYQAISGVEVPLHFQRLLNGTLILDATVTTATFNTGLQDSAFTLQ